MLKSKFIIYGQMIKLRFASKNQKGKGETGSSINERVGMS